MPHINQNPTRNVPPSHTDVHLRCFGVAIDINTDIKQIPGGFKTAAVSTKCSELFEIYRKLSSSATARVLPSWVTINQSSNIWSQFDVMVKVLA